MSKPKILIQLDPDAQVSTFDSVVALDCGVDHLLRYDRVEPTQVEGIVHGAIFTRGPKDLKHTAIFIGGSDVTVSEAMLAGVRRCFFGPMQVSIMLDANGANTTAAAAVLAATRHLPLDRSTALVLPGTGPVGRQVARLLIGEGASVRIGSRTAQRAEQAVAALQSRFPQAQLASCATGEHEGLKKALDGADAVIAAGTAGVRLLPAGVLGQAASVKLAIDLNAVPPAGIEGIEPADEAKQHDGRTCYGAIAVGGLKMKIHKAAVRQLFQSNDQVLDVDEIFDIGRKISTG